MSGVNIICIFFYCKLAYKIYKNDRMDIPS